MEKEPLAPSEIRTALKDLSRWTADSDALTRKYVFPDFPAAINFMAKSVEEIERIYHHPIWTNRFNVVEVKLTTWDIGNKITQLDVQVARTLDQIASSCGERDAEL